MSIFMFFIFILSVVKQYLANLATNLLHKLADDVSQLSSHSLAITGKLWIRLDGGSCVQLLNVALVVCFYFFTTYF